MRSNNDLLNASSSSTGPYLFIGGDYTIGTYNTNNSTFPWFIEMDGDSTFQSVNTTTLASTNGTVTNLNSDRISYKNEQLDNDIITSNTYSVSLSTKKLTILAPTNSMTVNLSTGISNRLYTKSFFLYFGGKKTKERCHLGTSI